MHLYTSISSWYRQLCGLCLLSTILSSTIIKFVSPSAFLCFSCCTSSRLLSLCFTVRSCCIHTLPNRPWSRLYLSAVQKLSPLLPLLVLHRIYQAWQYSVRHIVALNCITQFFKMGFISFLACFAVFVRYFFQPMYKTRLKAQDKTTLFITPNTSAGLNEILWLLFWYPPFLLYPPATTL